MEIALHVHAKSVYAFVATLAIFLYLSRKFFKKDR